MIWSTIFGISEAAVTCSFDPVAKVVTINSSGPDTIELARTAGGTLVVNNEFCFDATGVALATLGNTETINFTVSGPDADQVAILNISGTGFTGGSDEDPDMIPPTLLDEVEISVSLGGGSDSLIVLGRNSAAPNEEDTITLGTSGIALNEDDDADVLLTDVESLEVQGRAGNDIICAAGNAASGCPDDGDPNTPQGFGAGPPLTQGVLINGGAGSDNETGGNGDDTFFQESVSNGGDRMDGGPGDDPAAPAAPTNGLDTVDYSSRATRVVLSYPGAGDPPDPDDGEDTDGVDETAVGAEGDDVRNDVQNSKGGAGNDSLAGNSRVNLQEGGPGNDSLGSSAGDDTVIGGDGNDSAPQGDALNGADTILGGPGIDTVSYSSRVFTGACTPDPTACPGPPVFVNAGDNIANDGEVGAEFDNIGGPSADVENITGTGANDSIIGTNDANVLSGGAGNDTLSGLDGNDSLVGGNDNDDLLAGNGDDTLNGGSGNDFESGQNGNDLFVQGISTNGSDNLLGGAGID
ncbi:MAG: calcium-binding protein, partial [Acidimicrobiia bacterium]